MVIYTNSGRVKKYRKLIVELLLAAHCRDCTTCVKSGECVLQELAHRLGVQTIRFKNTREYHELDTSSPSLVRDPNKCILCGNCVRACEELQGIGALGFAFRGTEAMVMPAFNKKIAETECVNCGQCRVYCPTGAIAIKTHMDEAWEALADPNIRVVAQIAPAVRVAVGDHYGLTKGRVLWVRLSMLSTEWDSMKFMILHSVLTLLLWKRVPSSLTELRRVRNFRFLLPAVLHG